ncbi:hypothetical protein M0812_18588 [Anaeramoeba flamelloides]|uniref:Uncharacterized protein n=1 Tax=Anaeramoeba flamelloides TaxID=1746091 RepID=A0AAV7Z7E7_9EUKA|nr:hypothetical protein M0812_18588 [Anaeramoeba flamelloides]
MTSNNKRKRLKSPQKKKGKTINQKRLELLMKCSNNYVNGFKLDQLFQTNCPKEIRIDSEVLKEYHIEYLYLSLFFTCKYNLLPNLHSIENDKASSVSVQKVQEFQHNNLTNFSKQWLSWKFEDDRQRTINREWIKKANNITKCPKYEEIEKILISAFECFPNYFQGVNSEILGAGYLIPKRVTILKSGLVVLTDQLLSKQKKMEIINEKNLTRANKQKKHLKPSKIKAIYRGMCFFFSSRFNLINDSQMDRKCLVFSRILSIPNNNNNSDNENNYPTTNRRKRKVKAMDYNKLNCNKVPKFDFNTIQLDNKQNPDRIPRSFNNLIQRSIELSTLNKDTHILKNGNYVNVNDKKRKKSDEGQVWKAVNLLLFLKNNHKFTQN